MDANRKVEALTIQLVKATEEAEQLRAWAVGEIGKLQATVAEMREAEAKRARRRRAPAKKAARSRKGPPAQ